MKYIVFDLEWNQAMESIMTVREIPFEIIEIAAVMMDEEFNIIDNFQRNIKPNVYKEIHPIINEITGFTIEELNRGVDFRDAIEDFIKWCGNDYMFCTWGSQDLTELQMNMHYYNMSSLSGNSILYYDIQKIFSILIDNGEKRKSLKSAVDMMKINGNMAFHRAYADAYYTAMIMKNLNMNKGKKYLSVDTFIIPKSKMNEISISYDNCSKYVTRGFDNREKLLLDKKLMSVKCNYCNRLVKRKLRWFSDGVKNYYFGGKCSEHGYVIGRIRIRKNIDGLIYGIRTIKNVDENAFEKIFEKKKLILRKRKNKK